MIYLYIALALIFWLTIGHLLTKLINQIFKPRFKWKYQEEEYNKKINDKRFRWK